MKDLVDLVMEKGGASLRPPVLREADMRGMDGSAEWLCGIDEAGRGPLAGPVCAAAVVLPRDFPAGLLADSKSLSARGREKAYDAILAGAADWAVGWASCGEIGSLNILGATMLAMRRAFAGLRLKPRLVAVDGDKVPALPAPACALVKGDRLLPCIMAASILAKVARDRLMERLDAVEPEYGFSKNRGYPTEAHRAAIRRFGPSLWARKGFRGSGTGE